MNKTNNPIAWYKNRLHSETFAGGMLLLGAVIALVWANSPIRDSYASLSSTVVGPEALGLNLSLSTWAADGLLAIFFFVVGLELKAEFVTGSLRDMRQALVPMIAAVCGMIGPVLVYVSVIAISGDGTYDGWAIPVATDIAFALAVLGLFGKGLPAAARTFLLTLAVVDDLLGISIIAIFFTDNISFLWLAASLVTIALFGALVKKRITPWWILWPLGIFAWYAMLSSGIHATIAGVLLGLTVPALTRGAEKEPMTERFGERFDFWSSGIVLPVFAFFAAGVNIVDSGGFVSMLTNPVAIGLYLALPLGKFLGIWGGTALITKVFKLKLGKNLHLSDIAAVSLITGVGFTVSLLIASLSFAPDHPYAGYARVAVILGSLISAVLGAIALRLRACSRTGEQSEELDGVQARLDGQPNVPYAPDVAAQDTDNTTEQ